MALLELDDLSIVYHTREADVFAVERVSLALDAGRALGLVGESGCGKSTLALAALGLLPRLASTTHGAIRFEGRVVSGMPEAELRTLRWRRMAYVPQSALASLVPVHSIRRQFRDTAAAHGMRTAEADSRAAELLRRVELDPALLDRFPHELSGGMRQRAIIALALLFRPPLLVADEPTTGLDVIVQRQIVNLLSELRRSEGLSLIFISHDIGVVAELCDRVAVLYAGEVMEEGPTADVLSSPAHPYTMGLAQSFPDIRAPDRPLVSIAGYPPRLTEPTKACPFASRCPFVRDVCRSQKPARATIAPERSIACHFADAEDARRGQPAWHLGRGPGGMNGEAPIVAFREVHKHFTPRTAMFGGAASVRAVDGVSFSVGRGRVLGIAGESGSGKSTLANLLVGLERATAGEIVVDGHVMGSRPERRLRRAVQMVFQDPFASLNPRFTVGRSVEEPLLIHGIGTPAERREQATGALEKAELRPGRAFLARYPHELSGGQRQRVAIARATVLNPKLLVADEPVSMLDVSVRAGILRLLERLVVEQQMAMVFITHDLSIVAHICDDLAVMYRGRIVEQGPVLDLLRAPAHPYTQALIDAVPIPNPVVEPRVLPAKLFEGAGTTPSSRGCRFAPRCVYALPACEQDDPPQVDVAPGHVAACLRALELRKAAS